MSVDICKDVNKYVTTKSLPFGERGLALYLSCPNKQELINVNTAKYQFTNSFNQLLKEVNDTLISFNGTNIGPYKRDNENFQFLTTLSFEPDKDNIKKGLLAMINNNEILRGLQALSSCQFALNSMNFMEEKFCYNSIEYQFDNLVLIFFAIIGLMLLAVGMNKLTILLNPKFYQKTTMQLLNEKD
jgi:hypothetical protein